jgi:4-amino-4-deoxy-L-arabinose transferase-like glycosyltransferase
MTGEASGASRGATERAVPARTPGLDRREQLLVLGLALAGLILRLTAAVAFPVTPTSDSWSYHLLGIALSTGRGLSQGGSPETVWAPAYPFLVSLVYGIFGARWVAVYVLQALVDVGFCLLLWWWTRRRLGAPAALIALGLALASLSAIGSVRLLRTEILAAWLLISAMMLLDLSRDRRRGLLWVGLAGLSLGLLTLSRWQFTLFPGLVALWLFADKRRRAAALVLGVYLAVLAPWMLRNQRLVGAPVLSTQTGLTLYMSHFRNPGQSWGINTIDDTTRKALTMDRLAGNRFLIHETLRRLAAQPWIVARKYPEKLFYLLVPFDWEVLRESRTFNATYFVVALLSLFGLRAAWQRDRRYLIALGLPLVYLIVMTLPFYGSPRFRLPCEPLLVPVAALGLLRLRKRSHDTAPLLEATG